LKIHFVPKRFLDTETTENNGGAATENNGTTETIEGQVQEVAAPVISDDDLKSYGFDSKEALAKFIKEKREESISPEEKKAKEDLEKANFLKYSTENKLLNVDEYNQYETLKSRDDRDLVFENFLASYKEEHPEITDPKELQEAAEEDFNFEYKLNSTNEATKARAQKKLARDAKELRTPVESKVLTAQEKFKKDTAEYNTIKEVYPKFEKFVDAAIVKNAPDKKVVTQVKIGDADVNIEVALTKEDRDAIAKAFKTPKTFQLFNDGKPEEVQAALDKKIDGWILLNKKNEIFSQAVNIAKGIGTKEGSTVGANNPFPLQQGAVPKKTGEESLEESNNRMAQTTQKYRNR